MTGEQPLVRLEWEEYARQRNHQDLGGGYRIQSIEGDFPVSWRTLDADRHGARVVRVGGIERDPVALQEAHFLPGRPIQLWPETDDPDEPATIGVWDAAGTIRVGSVSRQDLFDVRRLLYGGEPVQAIVLWDWRSEGGMRKGLNLLVARQGVVEDLDAPAHRHERPPETRDLTKPLPVLGFAGAVFVVLTAALGGVGALIGGVLLGLVLLVLYRQRVAASQRPAPGRG